MKVKIYGRREGCKYCTHAKTICELNDFEMEFIDLDEAGISAADLAEICGEPVRTVPQIFVDDQYIGGCDKFVHYLKG